MSENSKIPIWWWSCKIIEGLPFENFGDVIAKYIAEKLTNKSVEWVDPSNQPFYSRKKITFSTGSIIKYAKKNCNVWGSGIMSNADIIGTKNIFAVRGPKTLERIRDLGLKIDCPLGDPALILPSIYKINIEKKYSIGLIPHYVEVDYYIEKYKKNPQIKVVDMRMNVEQVIKDINSCYKTLSSSLHGIIVSQAYGIPSLHVENKKRLSGDGIKYKDYFESVNIKSYTPFNIDVLENKMFEKDFWQNNESKAYLNCDLDKVVRDLILVCPYL